LGSFDNALLCGDFNFDADFNFREHETDLENHSLKKHLPKYLDVWPHLHPDEKGYTRMPSLGKKRYDRILFKSQKWQPTFIQIQGNVPFTKHKNEDVYPSDHFGLYAEFEKKENEESKSERTETVNPFVPEILLINFGNEIVDNLLPNLGFNVVKLNGTKESMSYVKENIKKIIGLIVDLQDSVDPHVGISFVEDLISKFPEKKLQCRSCQKNILRK